MNKNIIKNTCNKIIAFSLGIIMVACTSEYGYCTNYQNNTSQKGSIIFDGKKYEDYLTFEKKSKVENTLKKNSNKRFSTKRLTVKGNITESILKDIDEKYIYEMNDEYTVLSFESVKQTKEAYETLSDSNDVEEVFGENVYEVNDEITEKDFYRQDNLSWGSDYVNSPALIDYINENAKGKEIKVAVIDTGINMEHSKFKDRICEEAKSFVIEDRTVEDYYGHGSHVAGIIADNTPDCVKILPIKAVGMSGKGSDLSISEAIKYAIEQKVDVINMSLGGKAKWDFSLVEYEIEKAKDANIAVVVAAGNDSANADNFSPAKSDNCITVAASNEDGGIAGFSNYGNCIDVAAPGVDIYSTYMKNEGSIENYDYQSGTSMATPFAASAICMIKMLNSDFTVDKAEKILEKNVTHYSVNSANKNYGTGIIDLTNYTNSESCSGVVFDHLSGRYDDEFDVELTNDNNGEIYYTLDGSNPSKETANLYTEKIHVNKSVQIKAVAYADGLDKSKITKASYRFDDYDFDNNFLINDSVICGYRGSVSTLKIKGNIDGCNITKIGYRSFRKSPVTNIELPDSVSEISTMAFSKSKLKSISAQNVKTIGVKCFQGCSELVDVDGAFNECVYVGEYAFDKCEKLTHVYFPNCFTFADNVFNECKKMKIIYAPKSENVSCDYGRVLNKTSHYRSSYNNGFTITSNMDESIDILVNNYVFEKVEKNESINVPANADVSVLYKGSFKKIFADGKELSLSKSKFTFNIDKDVTLSANESNDVSDAFVYVSGSLKYSEREIKPDVTVELNGSKLIKGVDYTLSFKNNLNSGIAEILIEGIGEFKGSKSVYFYIECIKLDDCECVAQDMEYTGETIIPKIDIRYNDNNLHDYKIVSYGKNTSPGKGSVIIEGNGNILGRKELTFEIYISMQNKSIVVEMDDSNLYEDGTEKMPVVVVKYNGNKLVNMIDYEIDYSNNIKAGLASVIITGKNVFRGKLVRYFRIEKKVKKEDSVVVKPDETVSPTTIKKAIFKKNKINLRWKKNKKVNGYAIQIGYKKSFKGKTLKIKINKNSITKKIIKRIKIKKILSNLKKKKNVYVRIRTYIKKNGKYLYSSWSKTKKIVSI